MRALATGAALPVYLLYGEETYLVDRALEVLLPALDVGPSLVRLRPGDADFLGRAENALRSGSLFGGRPIAVVTGAEMLSEVEQDGLLGLLPEEPAAHLVLVGSTPDMRRRLFATCARRGAAFEFRRIPAGRLPGWLQAEARVRGHALAPDAAELLVELTGPDLRSATSEIEKLSLYVGQGEPMDAAAVSTVVGSSRTRSMLELADHVQRGELGAALALVRLLVDQGAQPIAMVAFLAGQLRRMLLAAEVGSAGRSSTELAQALGVSPWVAERIGAGARRYGRQTLTRALRRLAGVDVKLKSSRVSAAALLESFIMDLRGDARQSVRGGSSLATPSGA